VIDAISEARYDDLDALIALARELRFPQGSPTAASR